MRFYCGPTPAERMNESWRRRQLKYRRLENWHKKFAILPVRLEGTRQCVWLEFVERKGTLNCSQFSLHTWWTWEYQPVGYLQAIFDAQGRR